MDCPLQTTTNSFGCQRTLRHLFPQEAAEKNKAEEEKRKAEAESRRQQSEKRRAEAEAKKQAAEAKRKEAMNDLHFFFSP